MDTLAAIPAGVAESGGLRLARFIATAFHAKDEELFLVGGAIRDLLLGHDSLDLDFATSAAPARTVEILAILGHGRPYLVGEKFGTVGAVVDRTHIQVTTYRSAEYYPRESRKPEVAFGTSIYDDLQRRDFTINALAMDPLEATLVDPYGGHRDLQNGILRAVGEPEKRFDEDPLRLLRAVRFTTRLGLAVDGRTWRAIESHAGRLDSISRERIREEYEKILIDSRASRGLTLLRDSNLIQHSVPQLLELDRMADHGPHHPLSLWEHTIKVVSIVPREPRIRWAALLHDIAKPRTRTVEPGGRVRFFHHDDVGAGLARTILTDLRYPTQFVDEVELLVATHMHVHAYSEEWSDGALRRLMVRLGSLMRAAIALARADAAGHIRHGQSTSAPKYLSLERRIASLGQKRVQEMRSPLSGNDLIRRYQREPGPWIGAMKRALLDEVLDGYLDQDDVPGAWRLADRLFAREKGAATTLPESAAEQMD